MKPKKRVGAWGSWVHRAGVYALVFGGLFALNAMSPNTVQQIADATFYWQTDQPASTKLLELYGLVFAISTLFTLISEHSIRKSAVQAATA